ncbi:SLAP domain-containing protein [Alkalihalobacillus sp. AL-G]|uniref:SLAP domain-containing protein n=1 Tax=Alkalihalobacillus sp. AL-G TaxID=2926399 RepID=UPI00272BCDE4|nr:SLAP domain-containing protein [Alkalihalobacillus sp. AL-G]WLD93232.1 SLAP domain-containing protein [Alkalihalobacillus sp. AL-G]
MNHKLMFEPSWQKAISPIDRKSITDIFENSTPVQNRVIYTQIRAAMNHRGALLAMVLVQNGTEEAFSIQDLTLQYEERGRGVVAQNSFNLPEIITEANTSMPWTFVFPKSSINQRPLLKDWTVTDSKKSNPFQFDR